MGRQGRFSREATSANVMPDLLPPPPLPVLTGQHLLLRERRDSDIDDRLRYPVDPRISVEDMACEEDLVPPGVPKAPHNPDPPR